MKTPVLLAGVFLLAASLLPGCGNSPSRLPGKIAFVSNQFEQTSEPNSNYGIFVWENGKVRPIRRRVWQPRWDMRGERLFCVNKDGEIEIFHFPSEEKLGTVPLKGPCLYFALSRDGKFLVYIGRKKPREDRDVDERPAVRNLFIHHLETGHEEQLTFSTDRRLNPGSIDISQDGKTLAFDRDDLEDPLDQETGQSHVYVLDLETRRIMGLGRGDSPRFLPTEDALVYTTHELNGERFLAGPGKDPDGNPLYTIDLVKYDLRTGQKMRLTHNERFALERGTSFSPDGRNFVSAVTIFGASWEGRGLRLFKSDGTQLRALVGYDGHDYQDPDWGP